MINVSREFKTQMQHDTNFTEHAIMTLQSGEVLHLEASDFTVENNNFVDGASSTSFPLGVAVSKTIQIEIANFDEQYSNIDFFGAVIKLYIDYYLQESQTVESVLFGDFTVVSPETYGDTIIISAVDNMYIADKKYESNLVYPASLQTIFVSACNELSIAYKSADFRNKDYVVQKKPVDITYRQLFGYIAMIACGNARFNQYGALEIKSYDVELLESYERNISGGTFDTETVPYSDGDDYEGGTFSYADGDTLDGGTFDNWNVPVMLDQWSRLKVDTDDVVITGISSTYLDEDSNEHKVMYGENGYVLDIVNPLIENDEQNAVDRIGSYLVGIKFRVFDGDYIANPLIEFMDVVAISDRKLNTYISIVTDVNFEFFGLTSIKNNSESALRNKSKIYSDSVQTLIEARKLVQAEKSAREVAVEQLAYELANSNGLYMTTDVQPDGSTIYYMHNKPTLAESLIVWKMTATALGISTDGGQTYPYGLDVSGNAILNRIYAIGINADYIHGGTFVVGGISNLNGSISMLDSTGKQIGYWNNKFEVGNIKIDNGFYINGVKYSTPELVGSGTVTPASIAYRSVLLDIDVDKDIFEKYTYYQIVLVDDIYRIDQDLLLTSLINPDGVVANTIGKINNNHPMDVSSFINPTISCTLRISKIVSGIRFTFQFITTQLSAITDVTNKNVYLFGIV